MTQTLISKPDTLYLLVRRGFSPDEARQTLTQLAATTYGGEPWYQPQAVYTAASEGFRA